MVESASGSGDVYYDPYDVGIVADPYPTYRRLREEAPLYYNATYDFYALSRHADVEKALVNWQTFSNSRSPILEIMRADMEMPPGRAVQDPPVHTMHRSLMSRVFTPRRMAELESDVRDFCTRCLDPLVGRDRFDVIAELATVMPMRVIGMLLGIPESAQMAVRDAADAVLRTEAGKPMEVSEEVIANGDIFGDYIDWRMQHPSDDLMTQLLTAEFEDEAGVMRTLSRTEVLTYTQVLAGAGNETTGKLIGWLIKVLADHPDQRRELVADPRLIPAAVEETLRYEPVGPHTARLVMHDVEYHGTTVPKGSAVLLLIGSANRDERRHEQPDTFDIHRANGQHLTLGWGPHFCLGANLARLEGRVALEEMLRRFPEWEVDREAAKLAPTSTVRGWDTLPLVIA
jgi:cytochrome P450